MTTTDDIARAICCPSGTCCRPEKCYRHERNVPVHIPRAAQAVADLLCRQWHERQPAGPMSRTTRIGGE